jgi:hypothetical protein
MITRIYPLRLTRNSWDIPLFSYHKCTTNCKKIWVECENIPNCFIYTNNIDYDEKEQKCSKYGNIEKSHINISNFNIADPSSYKGPLHNPEMIVIPDTKFSMIIDYPLQNPVEFEVKAINSRGFTIKDIIYSIQRVYKHIYAEEERTATPVTYKIK